MDYETLRNSMTVQDAARVLKETNCYGTMDIAKNVILKALELQPRWIPVSESIPPFGQDVLVCDLDGDMYITYLHLNGTWGFEYCGNKIKNVVAWQELPAPFKSQERDDNVKINCNKTKCENCTNHNYCDDESCDEIWEKAYAERNGKK